MTSKINIFFVEKAVDGTIGGSHTCLYNLVSNLDTDKYNAIVGFYISNIYVDKFKSINTPVYLINRHPVTRGNILKRKLINWYRLVYNHRRELRLILDKNEIDVVVINNTIYYSEDIVKVCSELKIPLIVYERGYFKYPETELKLTNKIYASIPVSYAVKDNMEKQDYHGDKIVIYDGLPAISNVNKVNKNLINKVKTGLGLPDDSIVIGIIGNIREWKGQEYFVKAFMSLGEKYSNMYGLVIGGHTSEDEEYLESLKRMSESGIAGERLKFLGFRGDVTDLLSIMDVFVHASITPEPFGMVILEAMRQKVPIIATNFGGPVEILNYGEYGILVPPRDVGSIISGVEKYLNQRYFRDEIVEKAYERLLSDFDLRKTVQKFEELIEEIAGKNTH